MNELLFKIFICFLAGAGAGIGTGFAGMSAAGIVSPLLMTFCGISPYEAIGIGLASDVLASALTYRKNGNLDIKNALPLLQSSAFNKQRRFVESLTKQSEIVLRLFGQIEPAACRGGGYPLCCYINIDLHFDTLRGSTNQNKTAPEQNSSKLRSGASFYTV